MVWGASCSCVGNWAVEAGAGCAWPLPRDGTIRQRLRCRQKKRYTSAAKANAMAPFDNEQARVETAARYVALGPDSSRNLNQLADLTARVLGTPIALVTLVDGEHVWLKARHGLNIESVPREPGFCASCVMQDDPWIVEDARKDPRTQANSLVAGSVGVRAYLGIPLQTSEHCNIGALCVLDTRPRLTTAVDIANMRDLAAITMQNLELKVATDDALKKYSSELAQREQREARIRVLMREVAHRSKNLLAVVQAIAHQTSGPTAAVRQYVNRLTQRIHALSDTHELMAAEDWFGISLHQLLKRQLRPYTEGNSARVTFEGPSLSVNDKAAQNIGLAIHELVANAVTYGALSVPHGSVQISWTLDGLDPASSRLQLRWVELEGSRPAISTTPGFGSRVLTHLAPAALGGSAQLTLSDGGVQWVLDVPSASAIQ